MTRTASVLGAGVIALSFTASAWSQEQSKPITSASESSQHGHTCRALAAEDFSGVLDAPTQIVNANEIAAGSSVPAFCLVSGYITPNVGIKIGLPDPWTKRFIEMGCSGHCGVLPNDQDFVRVCGDALRKGYACIVSDMGHKGHDTLWAYNNLQAKLDWGYRSTHVTALAGKAIVARFYQQPPAKSYFLGGSTGGRQALQEAQRFPWDFDGVVAIAPAVDLSTIYMTFLWGGRVLHDQNGKPILGRDELKLLTDAALAKCDLDDGLKDGVIGDPLNCAFDPDLLQCKSGQTSGCLTSLQVDAVRKIYAGPMNSKGEKLSLGGPVVGSELGDWDKDPNIGWGVSYLGLSVKGDTGYGSLPTDGFRYLFFWPDLGPAWKVTDFDFDRDSRRLGTMQVLYDCSNPDLRQFKAAGGKLLVFQGLNDNSVLPRRTIDYYDTVERTIGDRTETQNFFRLFVLPGVGHGSGGPGADTLDYLSAIEAWVESNEAPDRLVAAHLKNADWANPATFPLDPAQIAFTRPVYPYPIRVRYTGRGDPNDAANFIPVRQMRPKNTLPGNGEDATATVPATAQVGLQHRGTLTTAPPH